MIPIKSNIKIYKEAAKNLGLRTEHVQSAPHKKVLLISNEVKFFLASADAPGFYPEVRRWNAHFSGSKLLTQKILKRLGYTVIPSKEVRVADFSSSKALFGALKNKPYKFPVLVKPDKGLMGAGIKILENISELIQYAHVNFKDKKDFMIQPILDQNEYRILVVGNEAMLMHSKHNPSVIGDGVSTIEQLLATVPETKKDSPFITWQHTRQKTKPSTVLEKDTTFEYHLTKKPTRVFYETNKIPAVTKNWALRLAKDISSSVVGIDVFIPGTFKNTDSYTVIELNTNPGVNYLPTFCNDHITPILIFEKVLRDYFKIK